MKAAQKIGIEGIGITLSEAQLDFHEDLETYVVNWRNVKEEFPGWKGKFEAVTAIGSLEHFVSPEEAYWGFSNQIYGDFFETMSWLLKPGGKLVVTAIHYKENLVLEPQMAKNLFIRPWTWGSPQFHLGVLSWLGGAYYPKVGELDPIAFKKGFWLDHQEDGTEDYRLTSEIWQQKLRSILFNFNGLSWDLTKKAFRHPVHSTWGIVALGLTESWVKQFRFNERKEYPTQLVRYVWSKR